VRISNGAVQPPLHRTPRAVVLSERFGSSEAYEVVLNVKSEKFPLGFIFGSLVAFSDRWKIIGILSQGAGELGPLGG